MALFNGLSVEDKPGSRPSPPACALTHRIIFRVAIGNGPGRGLLLAHHHLLVVASNYSLAVVVVPSVLMKNHIALSGCGRGLRRLGDCDGAEVLLGSSLVRCEGGGVF